MSFTDTLIKLGQTITHQSVRLFYHLNSSCMALDRSMLWSGPQVSKKRKELSTVGYEKSWDNPKCSLVEIGGVARNDCFELSKTLINLKGKKIRKAYDYKLFIYWLYLRRVCVFTCPSNFKRYHVNKTIMIYFDKVTN